MNDVKKFRQDYHFSLQDMGDLIGCSRQIVSVVESGERNFSREVQKRYDLVVDRLTSLVIPPPTAATLQLYVPCKNLAQKMKDWETDHDNLQEKLTELESKMIETQAILDKMDCLSDIDSIATGKRFMAMKLEYELYLRKVTLEAQAVRIDLAAIKIRLDICSTHSNMICAESLVNQ
jgi:transcriptional regulator with XRE-family HTH domain